MAGDAVRGPMAAGDAVRGPITAGDTIRGPIVGEVTLGEPSRGDATRGWSKTSGTWPESAGERRGLWAGGSMGEDG